METADILKAIRYQERLSQADLGVLLGVGRSQVCNIETGRNDLPANKLLMLLDLAGWKLTPPA